MISGFLVGMRSVTPGSGLSCKRASMPLYVHQGSQLSQHRMLQFTALRAAAAGEPILPFFDYLYDLADLVSRSRYVPEWVRVFYTTVYVEVDRLSLHFMFTGQQQWLTREGAELLGVDLHDNSIHYLSLASMLLIVLTLQCYPRTTRSVSCSSSCSSPAFPGLRTV
jgi:hypothetical protein